MSDPALLERVARMEQALSEARAAVDAFQAALARYQALLPRLRALEGYYCSPQWLADLDADRQGLLPADLPRGVLSQDAVHDLLEEEQELLAALSRLTGPACPPSQN